MPMRRLALGRGGGPRPGRRGMPRHQPRELRLKRLLRCIERRQVCRSNCDLVAVMVEVGVHNLRLLSLPLGQRAERDPIKRDTPSRRIHPCN